MKRWNVAASALGEQFTLATKISEAMAQSYAAAEQAQDLRHQLRELRSRVPSDANGLQITNAASALDQKAATVVGESAWRGGTGLAGLNSGLGDLMTVSTSADAAPTAQMTASLNAFRQALDQQIAAWNEIKSKDLVALNARLQQQRLPVITFTLGMTK